MRPGHFFEARPKFGTNSKLRRKVRPGKSWGHARPIAPCKVLEYVQKIIYLYYYIHIFWRHFQLIYRDRNWIRFFNLKISQSISTYPYRLCRQRIWDVIWRRSIPNIMQTTRKMFWLLRYKCAHVNELQFKWCTCLVLLFETAWLIYIYNFPQIDDTDQTNIKVHLI